MERRFLLAIELDNRDKNGIGYWLMKTEPDVFSFDDLVKCPKSTDSWDGIRNYQARNFMRDHFREGDRVLIYHSRIAEPAVVGLAEVSNCE